LQLATSVVDPKLIVLTPNPDPDPTFQRGSNPEILLDFQQVSNPTLNIYLSSIKIVLKTSTNFSKCCHIIQVFKITHKFANYFRIFIKVPVPHRSEVKSKTSNSGSEFES
jgi:hypothetical protein